MAWGTDAKGLHRLPDGISNAVQLASKYAEMERGRTTFNARCKELEDLLCLLSEAFDCFSAERVEQKESLLKTIDAAVCPLTPKREQMKLLGQLRSSGCLVEHALVEQTNDFKDLKEAFVMFLRIVAEHCVHGFTSIIYKQGKRTIEQKVSSICELQNVVGKMSLVQLKKSTKRSFELRTKKKFQLESLSSKRSRTVADGDNDSTGGPVAKKSKRSGRKEKKAKRSPKSKKTKSSKEVAVKFIRRSGRLTKKADMLDMSEPLVDQESVEDNEDDQFGIGKAQLVDVPEQFLAKQTLQEGVKVASSVVQKDPKAGLEKLEDTARIDIALVGSDMSYCVPLGPTEPHLGLLREGS